MPLVSIFIDSLVTDRLTSSIPDTEGKPNYSNLGENQIKCDINSLQSPEDTDQTRVMQIGPTHLYILFYHCSLLTEMLIFIKLYSFLSNLCT